MAKKQSRKAIRRVPRTVLRLPDLDQAKSAVAAGIRRVKGVKKIRCSARQLANARTVRETLELTRLSAFER